MECKRKGKCKSSTPLPQNDRETADQILTDIIDITVSTQAPNRENGPSTSDTNGPSPTAPSQQKFTGPMNERSSTAEFIERLNQSQERELSNGNQQTHARDVMELKSLPSDSTLERLLRNHNDRMKVAMCVELAESNVPAEAKQDYETTALQQTEGEVCAATCSHHHQCISPGVLSTAGTNDLHGNGTGGTTVPPNSAADSTADNNVDAASTESTRSIGSLVCRICHNGENPEKLVSPCLCKGSLSYVHVHCLERWISTSRSTVCELCQFQYNTEQTLRYTCLQSLRMWYSRAMSRRALQEDCQMFSLLTLVAFGIVGTLLVGIQYYLMQARNMGLGRIWTKGWLLFFLFTTLAVYFMNVYMIVRSQLAPWYRWWQSARDIKLILENRKPFSVRSRQVSVAGDDAEAPLSVATAPVAVPILEPEPITEESIIVSPPPSPTSVASQIDLVPQTQPSTVYFMKDTDRELLPLQESSGQQQITNIVTNISESDTSSSTEDISGITAPPKDLQVTVESGNACLKYNCDNDFDPCK